MLHGFARAVHMGRKSSSLCPARPWGLPVNPSHKVRADQLLADKGLAESREKAKRLIMAGQVFVAGRSGLERVDKPGRFLDPAAELTLKSRERFVSRGGHKLQTALDRFALDVRGKVALDAGASTGGFTDCLLQAGAARVYAVDVGHGQLHEKLRADERVINLERVNLRLAEAGLIPEPVDLVVADVSFISLKLVLPPCLRFLKPGGEVVALVKPQFELGPGQAPKGVVRDEGLRQQAVDAVVAFARDELGLVLAGCEPSAVLGPKGNQEYLAWFKRGPVS
jgi:23S rRNA (cytidine1920-2'-O)/16S rRNA (cytidine1409-2'-O)-methyltransferase